MPPNPGVTILLLCYAFLGVLASPIVLHSRDDVLPPRATALNVFAALFTILVLIIIAMWVIMRLINQALTKLSATVTGSGTSSSTSGTGETSTTLSEVVNYVWTTKTKGYAVSLQTGKVVGEVRRGPEGVVRV
ncbi:hypothetical protein B0T18DRAFT_22267 [Schizothecium vesticola]|uniref:Uncharacterized protein n=1 Tax=Schizothecium vesticola TaxID=314040 RepID=A0AA40F9M3_9PEZI|nr:hypothetical protein B0T18DRAFT_22267 [Schizothecium vesticola]